MDKDIKKHFSVEDVCERVFRIYSVKSITVSRGDDIEEMIISFSLPSKIHYFVDLLRFISMSSNLSYKVAGDSSLPTSLISIKIDLSLPF